MRRADFEEKMQDYMNGHFELFGTMAAVVIGGRDFRDFVWEELMGRKPTNWADCDECGKQFPMSTSTQKFCSIKCKNRANQRKRRNVEETSS